MDLATHQRGVLALIIGPTDAENCAPDAKLRDGAPVPGAPARNVGENAQSPRDPYLDEVAGSGALPVVRGIAASWQSYTLRRFCPLTWTVLDQRGQLRAVLERLRRRPLSQYLRLQAAAFTEEAATDAGERGDELIAAVARFERSVVLPGAAGDRVVIDWPCDPDTLLLALVERRPALDLPSTPHRTRAPADDPTAVVIEAL
jgi:hypothetical protein